MRVCIGGLGAWGPGCPITGPWGSRPFKPEYLRQRKALEHYNFL